MNTELINQASKSLKIRDLFLYQSEIVRNEDFVPPVFVQGNSDDFQAQFKNRPMDFQIFEKKVDDKSEPYILYKYKVGFRIMDSSDSESSSPLILCDNIYGVYYRMQNELSNEALLEFAKYNVGYHVWPYWREFVDSTCARLKIGKVMIPFYNTEIHSD